MYVLARDGVLRMTAIAQEKRFNCASVQSPVVNADGTVTFYIYTPESHNFRGLFVCCECLSDDHFPSIVDVDTFLCWLSNELTAID